MTLKQQLAITTAEHHH